MTTARPANTPKPRRLPHWEAGAAGLKRHGRLTVAVAHTAQVTGIPAHRRNHNRAGLGYAVHNGTVSRRDNSLLAEIERDALNEAAPLAATLRKCIALGAQARNDELRDWASQELNGYRDDSTIPPYRVVYAPLKVDLANMRFVSRGQQISATDLPEFAQEHISEEVKLARGVGDMQALVRNAERSGDTTVKLSPAGGAEVLKIMNYEQQKQGVSVHALYWDLSTAILEGALDQIRTTLVRLVSEIRATMADDESIPTAEQAAQAVNIVLHGGRRNKVNVNTAQAGAGGTAHAEPPAEQGESGWTKTQTIWTIISVVVAVVGAYFAYRQWRG